MKVQVVPREKLDVPVGALVMIPLFGLPLGAWAIEQAHIDFGVCGMKRAFELPCLSCGATRATLHLFHGDVFLALALQPMMMVLYVLLLIWGMVSLFFFARNKRVLIDLTRREDLTFKVSLIVIPLLNWAYLIWAGI
ncbi:MAG: DUF2752 domain-containing protein [Bradymonadaceae bacterium]